MDNEKLNILKLLIENESQSISIRQISIQRSINNKSAYQAILKLIKAGVVEGIKHPHNTACRFNFKFNSLVYQVEEERTQELLQNKEFRVIYNRLKTINSQFILLLFGSYAKKKTRNTQILTSYLSPTKPKR